MAACKMPQRVAVLAAFPTLDGPTGAKIQRRVLRHKARALKPAVSWA